MLSNLLLVLASTAALVNSQSTSSIDPNSVDIKTRRKSPCFMALSPQSQARPETRVLTSIKEYWCNAQRSACPLLCLQIASGVPESNNCTAVSHIQPPSSPHIHSPILNTHVTRKPSPTAVSVATASPPTLQSTPKPCRTSSAPKPTTNASRPAAIPPVNPAAARLTPVVLKTRPVSTSHPPLPRPWLPLAPLLAKSFRPVGLLVRLPVVFPLI